MKYRKIILIGMTVIASVIPVEAAVYGTLKQDICFTKEDATEIRKESGSSISIIKEENDEYLVQTGTDATTLVSKDLVTIEGIISKTVEDSTKIRAAADPSSKVLRTLKSDELVMALERCDNFYKVKVDDTVGYIYHAQIDTSNLKGLKETVSKGQEVVNYAKQYIGGRYVYGGNNLRTGVDCSGFVQQIMKQFGVKMSRSSRAQYASNGKKVSVSELQPGDLVYYGNGGVVNHAAIYAGNGQIVHASDSRTGIIMGNLHYGKPIIGVKRVI